MQPSTQAPRRSSTRHTTPDPHAGHLHTMQSAADWLGTSESTVRRLIARGELRAYRFGPRLVRIDPADLAALATPVTSLADLRGGAAA